MDTRSPKRISRVAEMAIKSHLQLIAHITDCLGCGGREFESRHSDHKPHYKAIYRLSNAVLLFMDVTIRYIPSSTILVGEKS